jgi:hypothetical protein
MLFLEKMNKFSKKFPQKTGEQGTTMGQGRLAVQAPLPCPLFQQGYGLFKTGFFSPGLNMAARRKRPPDL